MKLSRAILIAILITAFGVQLVQADWETRRVNDDYDDLMILTTGGVFQTSPWVQVVGGSVDLFNYYAFRSISLPNNSVINSAYLEFEAPFPWNYNQSCPSTIYGLKEGDLTTWNPLPDVGGMAKTTSFTNWDAYNLISSNKINVTVTDIVQEIYDQFSWYDGNDMGFQIQTIAVSGGQRYQIAHDSNSAKALKLYINYTQGTVGSEYWYKGYKVENVTAGTTMSFDWHDSTDVELRITTIEGSPPNYETHNFSIYNQIAPDNIVSVGGDIYKVIHNPNSPWNTSLFVSSDRGATWTNKGEVTAGAGIMTSAQCVALSYDEAGTIHIAQGVGWDVYYRNYTVSSGNFSALEMIYDGGYNRHEIRALWDDVNDIPWFVTYGGKPTGSLRNPVVMRRYNGSWENWRNEYDTAWSGSRENDIYWANGRMYWMCLDYQGAVSSRAIYSYELQNFSDITSWVPIGDQAFPQYLKSPATQYGVLAFEVGITDTGDFCIAVERQTGTEEFVYLYEWDEVGLTWDVWNYNLTGFHPASQPQFHAPKMFFDSNDELNMGLIVEQDSGYSLVYNDWTHFKTSESTPPTVVAKATGHGMNFLGGDMNPYSLGVSGWVVTPPPNGTTPNPDCIANAVTLEDIQACIDDALNDTDPFDPDPPASNYPEHEYFDRFSIKYYIWVIGQLCIIAPSVAMAWRRFPLHYYFIYLLTILVGFGLLWSLSGM
jgi:hypothetical protein